jgi:preprotein translocase subunit SecG
MVHTLLMVVFVLVAIAMIVLILLQRGAGAQAGSGFGAGASGTVFGSRGSANFLSSTTKWLAAVFFSLSLFMAWQSAHEAKKVEPAKTDLGVMNDLPADAGKAPAALPAAPAQALPTAPTAPASATPATQQPATQEPVIAPATPADTGKPAGKGG